MNHKALSVVVVLFGLFGLLSACAHLFPTSSFSSQDITVSHRSDNSRKMLLIEAKEKNSGDRDSVAVADYDNDGKVDYVRLSNRLFRYINNSTPPYRWGEESVEFFKGDGYRQQMIAEYGDHLENWKTAEFPVDVVGTTYYDGSFNGLKFKPIDDERIKQIFSLADQLISIKGKYLPKTRQVAELLAIRVIDLPIKWRIDD